MPGRIRAGLLRRPGHLLLVLLMVTALSCRNKEKPPSPPMGVSTSSQGYTLRFLNPFGAWATEAGVAPRFRCGKNERLGLRLTWEDRADRDLQLAVFLSDGRGEPEKVQECPERFNPAQTSDVYCDLPALDKYLPTCTEGIDGRLVAKVIISPAGGKDGTPVSLELAAFYEFDKRVPVSSCNRLLEQANAAFSQKGETGPEIGLQRQKGYELLERGARCFEDERLPDAAYRIWVLLLERMLAHQAEPSARFQVAMKLSVLEAKRDPILSINAKWRAAKAAFLAGYPAEAWVLLQTASREAESLGWPEPLARVYRTVGQWSQEVGVPALGKSAALRCLSHAQEAHHAGILEGCNILLAELQAQTGAFTAACDAYSQALLAGGGESSERGDDTDVLLSVGRFLSSAHTPTEAGFRALFSALEPRLRRFASLSEVQSSLDTLAEKRKDLDLEQACAILSRACLLAALDPSTRSRDEGREAVASLYLARLSLAQGDPSAAQARLDGLAASMRKREQDTLSFSYHLERIRLNHALDEITEARRIVAHLRTFPPEVIPIQEALELAVLEARLDLRGSHRKSAQENLNDALVLGRIRSLGARERMRAMFEEERPLFEVQLEMLSEERPEEWLQAFHALTAWPFASRETDLLSRVTAESGPGPEALKAVAQSTRALRSLPLSSLEQPLDTERAEALKAWQKALEAFAAVDSRVPTFDLERLQEALPLHTEVLSLLSLRTKVAGVRLDKNGLSYLEVPLERSRIAQLLEQLSGSAEQAREARQTLSRLLPTSLPGPLIIVADPLLEAVPFAALQSEGEKPSIISQAPDLSTLTDWLTQSPTPFVVTPVVQGVLQADSQTALRLDGASDGQTTGPIDVERRPVSSAEDLLQMLKGFPNASPLVISIPASSAVRDPYDLLLRFNEESSVSYDLLSRLPLEGRLVLLASPSLPMASRPLIARACFKAGARGVVWESLPEEEGNLARDLRMLFSRLSQGGAAWPGTLTFFGAPFPPPRP